MKRGFTLVELIIVIGIIAVLMASLMVATGGASESARAAKCMANIRNLASAANARAMECTYYPLAGSREVISHAGGQVTYDEQVGWISWLSTSDQYGHRSGQSPSEHKKISICPFYGTANPDDATFAITNGSLWRFTGSIHDVYLCPSHVNKHKSAKWSYVMNMKFGYDYTKGSGPAATKNAGGVFSYNGINLADRMLMFAELPTNPAGAIGSTDDGKGDEYQSDCTLQYHVMVDGKEYGKDWDGKTEAIGFNHVGSKKKRYGHVAFADGHVEKITYGGGLTPEELTALLCEGVDVAFDGGQWKKIDGQD